MKKNHEKFTNDMIESASQELAEFFFELFRNNPELLETLKKCQEATLSQGNPEGEFPNDKVAS